MIDAIDASRKVPLHRLLVALSIDHVGEETARLIANYFGTLKKVRAASEEEMAGIHGVGDTVAESLVSWLEDTANRELLDSLLDEISIENPQSNASEGVLQGKTLVFTGTLPSLSRSEAEDLARMHGGHVASSVSKKTDYVVAGSDAGSKEEKARELGVTILSEREFTSLLNS